MRLILSHGVTFVSDHCLIKVELDIKRNEIEKRLVTTRNFKNFDQDDFNNDLVFQWNDNNTLDELVQEYKKVTELTMDKHAPTITRRVTVTKCELWYNDRIREQKKKVRRRERVWRKYVEDHQWKTYTEERNRFNRMIFANKQETFRNKVQECGRVSKKLYQLINNVWNSKTKSHA